LKPAPVLTSNHPTFLLEVKKQGEHISLVCDVKKIPIGSKYIAYHDRRFVVFKRSQESDRFVRSFPNVCSAVFCVRKK